MDEAALEDHGGLQVIAHPDEDFYELLVDEERAGVLAFSSLGKRRVITHTVIAEEHRGHGLSNALISGALDDLAAMDVTIANRCPVVDRFLQNHPEYELLIDRATDRPSH